MKINVHAGHNPAGKTACGAVGHLNESTEARKIRTKLIDYLKAQGHTVYDCTCDNGTSQTDVLQKIVAKCNAHTVDLDVSIHLNSGGGTGTECLIYGTGGTAAKYAENIQSTIVKQTGYKNRGVKIRTDLYVLRKTKAPAVLIECAFVDSKDDASRWNADTMAKAICEGITGKSSTAYKVTITTDKLIIRKKPDKFAAIVTTLDKQKGQVYTIAETSAGGSWGRLKSGAGWIALKNTK